MALHGTVFVPRSKTSHSSGSHSESLWRYAFQDLDLQVLAYVSTESQALACCKHWGPGRKKPQLYAWPLLKTDVKMNSLQHSAWSLLGACCISSCMALFLPSKAVEKIKAEEETSLCKMISHAKHRRSNCIWTRKYEATQIDRFQFQCFLKDLGMRNHNSQ